MRAPTIPVRSLNRSLPQPIEGMLAQLDRRVLVASLARGLGTTALVASIAGAAGLAADFLWALPQALRWGSFGAAIAAVVIAFGVTVVRAILRRPGAFDLAAVAERTHPGVGELLTGAVGLLGGGSPAHGSSKLIEAVADRAAERAAAVEPSRVIPWRRAGRRLAIGLSGSVRASGSDFGVAGDLWRARTAFSHAVGRYRAAGPAHASSVTGRLRSSGGGGSLRHGVGPRPIGGRLRAGGSLAAVVCTRRASDSPRGDARGARTEIARRCECSSRRTSLCDHASTAGPIDYLSRRKWVGEEPAIHGERSRTACRHRDQGEGPTAGLHKDAVGPRA